LTTLRLLRHAKSDWGDAALGDRERGLNKRGRKAAPMMGAALAKRIAPQTIHLSPARRTQMTLAGVCEAWPELALESHVLDEALYTFSARALIAWLQAFPGDEDLFLLGHNPAFTELVNWCVGVQLLNKLPTAGFVELALEIDEWQQLEQGCGELVYRLFPREISD
jgi:phosphohistidine phosphatase